MATPSPVWLLVAALRGHYQRRACAEPGCGRVLPDDAVRAQAELLGHIVPLVDDEFLVEDLRVVSPWRPAASPRL